MTRTTRSGNGKSNARTDRLEDALSVMLSTQADFFSRTAAMDREMGAMRRDLDDMRQEMRAIAEQLTAAMRMIERLPDAVKEKMGFRG